MLIASHDFALDAPNTWDETPLHLAASSGSMETVKYFIGAGADKTLRDHMKRTPYTVAEDLGFDEELLSLLSRRGRRGAVTSRVERRRRPRRRRRPSAPSRRSRRRPAPRRMSSATGGRRILLPPEGLEERPRTLSLMLITK